MTNIETGKSTSRRDWFAGSAALLGAGAISSILARAQSTGTTTNDINILNFALRLENLEATFYQQALAMFTPANFANSAALQTIGGTKIGANIVSYIEAISQNEQDHVTKLVNTIVGMGGTPQPIDCYNFGITSADTFLETAQVLENTGVMAYDGAIAMLQNTALQTVAATIATVEARHAAYLNLLNFTLPFPSPFDTTETMSQILSAIGQYLTTGCSVAPPQLTQAIAGPAKHSIITTNQSTVQLTSSLSTSATGKPLSYLWQQDLGSPLLAVINDQFPTATAILMDGPGEYSIGLRVTDSLGNSDQDDLKIIYQP
jgi:bacterioferritin (cytochrome b1)